MPIVTTKLPTSSRPIIQDPDLAAALENVLAPYEGKRLERAQAAIRRVASSPIMGPFATVLAAYQSAVTTAVGGDKEG